MSTFPIKKKHLLPSDKAWRSFTSKLQSKLQKLKNSKSVKKATTHLNTLLRRRSARSSPYQIQTEHGKRFHTRNLHHQKRSFSPVYVDELFQDPVPTVVEHVEPKIEVKKEDAKIPMTTLKFGTVSERASSSSSSSYSLMVDRELGEVDVRAEMFIAKFKEEMRLQRQRSFEQYQEMLARGV